ncbi:MAG: NAD(P)H-dependent oxidoreductase [Oscillospiraceae bacterium]|nr:NAD(P)H-dependent oxidoreductase [Oscillospiraceae bacterium]
MKTVVINGTEQKGCTYQMKEMFLDAVGRENEVTEYVLPKDCPVFCIGCKACFFSDISVCPHKEYTAPIWASISAADLLVFTSPTYVFHVTAQMKALLDHFGTKWMAHSPEPQMFTKRAVIITNAIGQGMGNVIKDIKDSLDFWGVARTYVLKQALSQAKWDLVSDKRKANIRAKCGRIAAKIKSAKNANPTLKVKGLFLMMRLAQKMIDKSERKAGRERTADYLHWQAYGYFDGRIPWKSPKRGLDYRQQ